jgi:hypothetical protein
VDPAAEKRDANLKPFPKGKSGNPSGTSKQFKEFQALAREWSVPILKRFAILGMKANSAFAVRAGEAVLERAWGKAPQPLVGAAGGPVELAFRGAARAALEAALEQEDAMILGAAAPKAPDDDGSEGGA